MALGAYTHTHILGRNKSDYKKPATRVPSEILYLRLYLRDKLQSILVGTINANRQTMPSFITYVTVFRKTDLTIINTEIHFLPVHKIYAHRATTHLTIDGQRFAFTDDF